MTRSPTYLMRLEPFTRNSFEGVRSTVRLSQLIGLLRRTRIAARP